MPRYTVPSNSTTVGQLILDKDEYEFAIGTPDTFLNLDRDTQEPRNWGVSYPLTIVGGNHDGKSIGRLRFYLHSPGAVRMTKGFVMAALGYTQSQTDENKFNTDYPSLDIDPDSNDMAACFTRCEGKRIRAAVDVKPNAIREGEVQNTYRWFPAE